MKRKISIVLFLVAFLSIFILIKEIKAETVGSATLSVDKTEVEKGQKVTVTVTVNSNVPLGFVNYQIKYDNRYFSIDGYSGVVNSQAFSAMAEGKPFTEVSQSFEFTAKENVSDSKFELIIGIGDVVEYENLQEVELKITNTSVSVIDHKASSNANLASINLSTGYLWPEFNPNTTVYAVGLDYSITSLNMTAIAQDGTAKVTFDSSLLKDLKVGQTDVKITVTAENGSTKTYVLQVVRYDKESESEGQTGATEKPSAEKDARLIVTLGGKEYSILRDISAVRLPTGYELSVISYNNTDVAVAENKITGLILMYLTDNDGNADFFIYDKAKNTFSKYVTLTDTQLEYVLLTPDKLLENTKSVKLDINGVNVTTYVSDDVADIYFFYAMNGKGEKNWYGYDAKEGTIQRMYTSGGNVNVPAERDESEELSDLKLQNSKLQREIASLKGSKKATYRLIAAIVLAVLCFALAGIVFYMSAKNKKKEEEYNDLVDSSIAIKKQLDETLELVAATDEKFRKEREAEEKEAEIQSRIERAEQEEKSISDDVLKSEIDKALEKLSSANREDAVNIKFNMDDDLFK